MPLIETKRIEIPLNKGKLILSFIAACIFIVCGFWLLISPPNSDGQVSGNSTFIVISGISSIIICGIIAFFAFRKMKNKKAGLIIDHIGITDNTNGIASGRIAWPDIKGIKTRHIINQKFLMIVVANPQEYISLHTNIIIRTISAINYKIYGSPIRIPADILNCDFENLIKTLKSELEKNKNFHS